MALITINIFVSNFAKRKKKTLCAPIYWDYPNILGSRHARRMPSLFILASNVVGFSPNFSAAPPEPLTRQDVSSNTLRMCSLSSSIRVGIFDLRTSISSRGNQSPISSLLPRLITNARSIIFSNSRTLPGQ